MDFEIQCDRIKKTKQKPNQNKKTPYKADHRPARLLGKAKMVFKRQGSLLRSWYINDDAVELGSHNGKRAMWKDGSDYSSSTNRPALPKRSKHFTEIRLYLPSFSVSSLDLKPQDNPQNWNLCCDWHRSQQNFSPPSMEPGNPLVKDWIVSFH